MMRPSPKQLRALSVVLRRLPVAGRGYVIRQLGIAYVSDSSPWPEHWALSRSAGGTVVPVDLADYADRVFYLTGRSTELAVESALSRLLRPGDVYVDVGANNGFTVASALDLVGNAGSVIAVEPNPGCCRRLNEIQKLNRLEHFHVLPLALGSERSQAALRLPGGRSGHGTLAHTDDRVCSYVRVERADAVLADLLSALGRRVRCIKLDVEGFEPQVVEGMEELLKESRPYLIAEHEPILLERAGNSPSALAERMRNLGYEPRRITRVGRFPFRISMDEPFSSSEAGELFFSPRRAT
jgi:FkbM family methyltransferase